ncbi:MAG TPA: histidine ammonia-lyase [Candidatus Polarisedimenticolaceae bacterium]|nr:histidine ammonia-lyase [Candidatus Polarisedimenticolaceae bacterium]
MRVVLDGASLTLEAMERVAGGASCALSAAAKRRVRASRAAVERAARGGRRVYGVNTGFGHLANVGIPDADLSRLQVNLIRSHAAGVGEPLTDPVVRAILALRANCLARGHSGLRLETLERMLALLRAGVVPVVPEQGSVGASGDLAPLAHVALALIGEGDARYRGRRMPAREALRRARLSPVVLGPKEGIALINGTQVMTAIGGLALLRAERLAVAADVVGGMTLEALSGSHRAFDRRIHDARPQRGQVASAANLRKVLKGSAIERDHADCDRVQDAYSLRCIPQVHGAARDTFRFVREVLTIEINASTDNPMVFAASGDLVSGGNFHGQPVAIALDHLAIAACALATISERRIERLVNPALSELPPFLAKDAGLNSGFMMAHVTAAALVSENKVLAHPASVDTIPTSAGKEDHVSMGVHAARKAARIVEHAETVLAIELLAAAQALDFRKPLRAGRGADAAHRAFRRRVPSMERDRVLAPDIETARRAIVEGAIRSAAEAAVGALA